MASMHRGGAERSLINLLEMLSPDKYDIAFLCFDDKGELMNQIPQYVRCLSTPRTIECLTTSSVKRALKIFSLPALYYRVRYKLACKKTINMNGYIRSQQKWEIAYKNAVPMLKEKFDVAVAFMHSLPTYYVIDKVQAQRKFVWVHHDYSTYQEGKDFDFPYFSQADRVVTVSQECAQVLCNIFPSISDQFTYLMNLNPVEKIRRQAVAFIPNEYLSTEGKRIVSIGRLVNIKRFDRAIEAASILHRMGLPFNWFIIGVGELHQQLSEQISRLKLENCVHLLGARENPYPYIKYADVVVQTSSFEGKSIVLDEAKILCRPIISTDYASVHDQIVDGETGIIVSQSSEAIAEALMRLFAQPEMGDRLSHTLKQLSDDSTQVLAEYEYLFDGCYSENMER